MLRVYTLPGYGPDHKLSGALCPARSRQHQHRMDAAGRRTLTSTTCSPTEKIQRPSSFPAETRPQRPPSDKKRATRTGPTLSRGPAEGDRPIFSRIPTPPSTRMRNTHGKSQGCEDGQRPDLEYRPGGSTSSPGSPPSPPLADRTTKLITNPAALEQLKLLWTLFRRPGQPIPRPREGVHDYLTEKGVAPHLARGHQWARHGGEATADTLHKKLFKE